MSNSATENTSNTGMSLQSKPFLTFEAFVLALFPSLFSLLWFVYFNSCRVSACRWAPASKTRRGNNGQSCVLPLFCSLFHFYIILILTSLLIDGSKKYWITAVQFIIHILYSPSFDLSNLFDPLLLLLFVCPPPLSAVRHPSFCWSLFFLCLWLSVVILYVRVWLCVFASIRLRVYVRVWWWLVVSLCRTPASMCWVSWQHWRQNRSTSTAELQWWRDDCEVSWKQVSHLIKPLISKKWTVQNSLSRFNPMDFCID